MKTIFYKNEFLKEIDDNEAQKIIGSLTGKRQTHINFKGELLKTSQIEVRDIGTEQITEKKVYEMTTEELKETMGDFEEQYNQHKSGEIIHNGILGDEFEGIIDWVMDIDVITKKEKYGLTYWFIVYPTGIEWRKKRDAMRELQERRRFAQKQISNNNEE